MNKLKFLGSGGAFSKIELNNSAYLTNNDTMILLDCGETVFHRLLKIDILDNIKNLYIILTHFHSDHVGSLGSLVFYCRYKNIKCNIIFPKKNIVDNYLNIVGIDYSLYNFIYPNDVKEFYLKDYKQIHGDYRNNKLYIMPSYGYHLKYLDYNFYYSGDTTTINDEIIKKFNNGDIDIIYHEVSTDSFPVHFPIDKLCNCIDESKRNRVYCMHLSDNEDIEKIKNMGFNVVRRRIKK